jgi:hypothetical protein
MARYGQPEGWSERFKSQLVGVTLPEGAEFYATPGHGYLRVDVRKLPANVSDFDYLDGPHHVLLEEDCSLPLWLAEAALIPWEDYMERMAASMEREPVGGLLYA